MKTKGNILIIEDDDDIREWVSILLKSEGYTIIEADCGAEGLKHFTGKSDGDRGESDPEVPIDLVLLDIMLPDISGLKICREIRESSYVPILFLTAKDMESDKLIGLMEGGDDYLTKPFSYAELLGRVKALLRRYKEYNGVDAKKAHKDAYIEMNGIRIST